MFSDCILPARAATRYKEAVKESRIVCIHLLTETFCTESSDEFLNRPERHDRCQLGRTLAKWLQWSGVASPTGEAFNSVWKLRRVGVNTRWNINVQNLRTDLVLFCFSTVPYVAQSLLINSTEPSFALFWYNFVAWKLLADSVHYVPTELTENFSQTRDIVLTLFCKLRKGARPSGLGSGRCSGLSWWRGIWAKGRSSGFTGTDAFQRSPVVMRWHKKLNTSSWMRFLHRTAGLSLRDKVRISVVSGCSSHRTEPAEVVQAYDGDASWTGHDGRRPRGRPRTLWRDERSWWENQGCEKCVY